MGEKELDAGSRSCVGVGVGVIVLFVGAEGVCACRVTGLPCPLPDWKRSRTNCPENRSSNKLIRISKESTPAFVNRVPAGASWSGCVMRGGC